MGGGKNGANTCKGPGAGVGLELPRVAGAEGMGESGGRSLSKAGRGRSPARAPQGIMQPFFPLSELRGREVLREGGREQRRDWIQPGF